MSLIITTRYETRPNSNVGKVVARSLGRQRSVVDQSLSADDRHFAAASRLAEALVGAGLLPTSFEMAPVGSNDSGTKRQFEVTP